jgi:hypothetical protein
MRFALLRAFALLSLAAVVSCDSGGGNGTFTLTITEASLTLGQGVTDTIIVSLARADFDKPIALTIEGLPSGVTGTFQAANVPGGLSTVGLFIAVAPTAALGSATLTVRANAEGKTEQVTTMDITVELTGTYSLSSYGFPLKAAQGGGGVATIQVVRAGGHGDNVTLAASNVPSGVTATFGSSPTSSIGTSISFAVDAGVAPGSYPITITGTAPGLTDRTTQIQLDVISPPATASFSMPFCASGVPVWFAYQNTGYQWQVVTPVAGVFTFQATSTLAVAYTFVVSTSQVNETDINILYASRAELAGKDSRDCAGADTLTGSISGATSGQSARISMGPQLATSTTASPTFSVNSVPHRTLDLLATKGTITNTQSNLQVTPDKLLIQRGLNPPAGKSAVGNLDFTADGFAPTSTFLTISNLTSGDAMNVGNSFWTGTSSYGVVHSFQPTAATNQLWSMPAAKFQAGDLHELLVETFQSGFSFGRVNVAYLGAITGDRTETMGANLSTPTATNLTSSPYARMRGTLPVQADYPSATRFIYFQAGGSSADRLIFVVMTSGYLGGTPSSWEVTIPEFGSVSGLNANWLPSTNLLLYQAEAYASPGAVLFGGTPAQGDVVKVAYRISSTGSLLRAGSAPALRASLKRGIESRQYLRR